LLIKVGIELLECGSRYFVRADFPRRAPSSEATDIAPVTPRQGSYKLFPSGAQLEVPALAM
jgi:hypothetical protein